MSDSDESPSTARPAADVDEPPTYTESESREQVLGGGISWLARWSLRWIAIAVGLVVIALLVRELWSIVLPVVLAMILATVLAPPTRWLKRIPHMPPVLAAATVVIAALAVVAAIGALIFPSLADQVTQVASQAGQGLDRLRDWVVDSKLPVTDDQVQQAVEAGKQRLSGSASSIASGVLVGLSAVGSALVTALLTVVLAFLFLKDGHRFLPWVARQTGPRVGPHLDELGRRAWNTLGGFIRTQALVGLIDAALIGLGLILVGVPLALVLTVLTFFAAFVPVAGAVAVGLLAVLVTLVSNGLVAALIITAVILAVQQIEGNVLLPILQGKSLNLHPAVILLAVTLGSSLFGIIGAFLAVPVTAVLAEVWRYLDEQVRARSGEQR